VGSMGLARDGAERSRCTTPDWMHAAAGKTVRAGGRPGPSAAWSECRGMDRGCRDGEIPARSVAKNTPPLGFLLRLLLRPRPRLRLFCCFPAGDPEAKEPETDSATCPRARSSSPRLAEHSKQHSRKNNKQARHPNAQPNNARASTANTRRSPRHHTHQRASGRMRSQRQGGASGHQEESNGGPRGASRARMLHAPSGKSQRVCVVHGVEWSHTSVWSPTSPQR
jgi:hypothetical protein